MKFETLSAIPVSPPEAIVLLTLPAPSTYFPWIAEQNGSTALCFG
jgi:hypothetical protein